MDDLRRKIRKALDGGIGASGPTVGTSVPVEVLKILEEIAREHNVYRAEIIRRAIEVYLSVYLNIRKGI